MIIFFNNDINNLTTGRWVDEEMTTLLKEKAMSWNKETLLLSVM